MAVTNYYTVEGEIIGEQRPGEADSRDYVLDYQGNVVLVLQNDWGRAEASYDPYGQFLGNWDMSNYRFSWHASYGYRTTNTEWSSHYVRARHYAFMDGAWTTVDPLWPMEMPYGYVEGRVTSAVDYWGIQQKGKPKGISIDPSAILDWLKDSTECLIEVVQLGYHLGPNPLPCNELRSQAFSACLTCCNNQLPLITSTLGSAYFASVGATGGAVVGGYLGAPIPPVPILTGAGFGAAVGGVLGGLIGAHYGKKCGQDLAERYCLPMCDQLIDWDCDPCKPSPEWDPLKEINKAWPTSPDDWIMLR